VVRSSKGGSITTRCTIRLLAAACILFLYSSVSYASELQRLKIVEESVAVLSAHLESLDRPSQYRSSPLEDWTNHRFNPETFQMLHRATGFAGAFLLSFEPVVRPDIREAAVIRSLERIRDVNEADEIPLIYSLYAHPNLEKRIRKKAQETIRSLIPYASPSDLLMVRDETGDPETHQVSAAMLQAHFTQAVYVPKNDPSKRYLKDVAAGIAVAPVNMAKSAVLAFTPENEIERYAGPTYLFARGVSRNVIGGLLSVPQQIVRIPDVFLGIVFRGEIGETDGKQAGSELFADAIALAGAVKAGRAIGGRQVVRAGGKAYRVTGMSIAEAITYRRFVKQTRRHEKRVTAKLKMFGINDRHVDLDGPYGKAQPHIAKVMASAKKKSEMTPEEQAVLRLHSDHVDHHRVPQTPEQAMHTVIDKFDAATSSRDYHMPVSAETAFQQMRSEMRNPKVEARAIWIYRIYVYRGKAAALPLWREWQARFQRSQRAADFSLSTKSVASQGKPSLDLPK
jgi:hypothetical protein